MSWTMPADLRTQVQRLWDKGTLLAELAGTPSLFPKRMNLKGPSATELAERFPEARDWIARLAREAKHYRVVCRSVNHRVLGANFVPTEIWIDTLEDALGLIGRGRDAARFTDLVALTGEHQPCLIPWLAQRPLRALELAEAGCGCWRSSPGCGNTPAQTSIYARWTSPGSTASSSRPIGVC